MTVAAQHACKLERGESASDLLGMAKVRLIALLNREPLKPSSELRSPAGFFLKYMQTVIAHLAADLVRRDLGKKGIPSDEYSHSPNEATAGGGVAQKHPREAGASAYEVVNQLDAGERVTVLKRVLRHALTASEFYVIEQHLFAGRDLLEIAHSEFPKGTPESSPDVQKRYANLRKTVSRLIPGIGKGEAASWQILQQKAPQLIDLLRDLVDGKKGAVTVYGLLAQIDVSKK